MENKKELVFKALRNEPAERVPVGFWHHYLEDEHVNAIEHEGFYEENIAGVKSFSKEFDPDFVKVMTDGYFDLPIDLDISSAKTLLNFAAIPFSNPWFQKQLRLLAENRRIYDGWVYSCEEYDGSDRREGFGKAFSKIQQNI